MIRRYALAGIVLFGAFMAGLVVAPPGNIAAREVVSLADGTAVAISTPAFIQVGKRYAFTWGGGGPAQTHTIKTLRKDGWVEGLKDSAQLFEVIRPRRQVKAFIYGHTHDWKVSQDESGIHLINLPPVAYVFKELMPSGWVRAELERSGMKLELRCIKSDHPQQGQKLRLKWRK